MLKKLKLFSFALLLYTLTFTLSASPISAACDPKNPGVLGECPAGLNEIEGVFSSVVSVVVGLGFIVLLILLVLAGIKYLTSGGEPKAIQAAHLTVTWALLGIVFMAVAWIILQLIHSFTGIDVTIFNIKVLCNVGVTDWCKP